MITLYINSLDNLLIRKNPIILIWMQGKKNVRVLWNLPKNIRAAKRKVARLERQCEHVEVFMQNSRTYASAKFDVTR